MKEETKFQCIKALKANVDLWLDYAEKDVDLDYLFNTMQKRLDEAKACLKRK